MAAAIAIVALVAGLLFYRPFITTGAASQAEISSTPTNCSAGNFLIGVSEDGTGVLTLSCSAGGSGDSASNPNSCGAGNWVTKVNESAAGAIQLVCSAPLQETASTSNTCSAGQFATVAAESSGGALTLTCSTGDPDSSPSACASHQYVTRVIETTNALTLTCSTVSWTNGDISSFPSACAAGSFVSTLATTPVCTNSISRLDSSTGLSSSTPTLVQNTFATFTSGTSGSKAFTSNLAAKNTVVVCEGQVGTTTLPGAPTDTLTLTYTNINSKTQATNIGAMQCWKAMTKGGGADTVTTGTYGTTCNAGTTLCFLFIQEMSGTDIVMIASTVGSASVATTSPTMTSVSFTNTPLLLGFYIKPTTGTDTAGASFTLLNGESGSLEYLTEQSTSLSSTSTTFPATFGTSSAFVGVGIIVIESATFFSVSLSANTNYVFRLYGYQGQQNPSGTFNLWLHQMDTGVTLQALCITGSATATNNVCGSAANQFKTDTNIYGTNIQSWESFQAWGSVKVGSAATTLLFEFGSATSSTTNSQIMGAGSFLEVTPVA